MIFAKNDSQRIVTFKSIDIENLDSFYNIDFINKGIDNASHSIVIGNLLAQRLNVSVGDPLTIMSPIDQSSSLGLPILLDVKVGIIFNSHVWDFDDRRVFIKKEMGNRIFLPKRNYDRITSSFN
jgi:ABC-type transport system, involved in lipoprotein release, permease component